MPVGSKRLFAVAAAGFALVASAVTNELTFVSSVTSENMRTLGSSNWTDGLAPHPGADYLIGRSSVIRLPAAPFVFLGDSLQLGTDRVKASLASKTGELTFANNGLYLKNVSWSHWNANTTSRVNGRVTVLSKRTAPVVFTNSSNNDQTALEFTGDWHAAPDCGIRLTLDVPQLTHRLILTGDLRDYLGEILVEKGAILSLGRVRIGGEVRLSGANGSGQLETLALDEPAEIGTLTLEANSRLRCSIRRRTNGDLAHSILRVTDRLAVAGPVALVVPDGVLALADRDERRLDFLSLTAGAGGDLKAADFRVTDSAGTDFADRLRLEVGTEPTGERTLRLVFAATENPQAAIRYEDFGAVGDGVTDDMDAIAAAHATANRLGLPVRARDGATYYIGLTDRYAEIQTDVDFGTARFILDDAPVPVGKRGVNLFRITPTARPFNPVGVERIVRGEHRLGVTLPGPCLVEAVNTNKMIFIRSGANVNDGSAQQEVFLADADGSLDRDVPMQWDFEKVTSLTAYPLDADTLTVKGGVFETRANVAESKYNYYTRGFIISRANVRIEGMRHEITGELDHGAPYTGFLSFSRCAHATVTNCVFTAHKSYATIGSAGTSVTMGSYDVNVGSSIDVRLLDCRQTTDLRDSGYWGVYTSNFSKNLLLDGCSLSRFDAHQGVANATVRNSVIGYMGLKAVGCGTFLVENTEVLANYLFELRGDYGSPWEGEFVIRDCRIVPNVQKVVRVVHGSNNGQHDFGYPCSMPWRITIEGLEIADAGRPANIGGPYLFSDFNAANTSAAYFEPYPYKVTEEVVLRDVRIASGRTLQVSPNKWMFRNLRKTDALPADLDCAICGIATGWNWTNLTVAAEVRALDLAAVRNGRLVLTVTDTAGRTVAREERPMTGTGAVDFAVALPEGGRNYLYELSAYDGETRLTYVTGDRAAARFCGAPQGGAWFAATAKGGVAQAVNGRWSGAPPETTGDAFRVSEPVEFAVTDREPGRNRSTCVELDYEVDDFVCPGVLSTDAAMTAFAACGDETAQDWRAVRRTATGRREWFVLHGRRPEAGVRYRVRIETDFTVVPARIRYSVRGAGETAFTVLTDGEGRAWHASGTDAATLGQVRFLGRGRTADLRGSVGDAAVAETGGVRYGDLNEALAAGAANGTAVTLLADVAFQPDRATGAAEVRLAGHRFKWRDGDRYALVHDPATRSFRGVRIDGTTANGLGGYASYALGLDATDPSARPRAGILADGGTFRIALDVNPPANTGARIRYRLVESARPDFQESTTGAAQDAPEFRVPVGDGGRFYRILIDIAAPQ